MTILESAALRALNALLNSVIREGTLTFTDAAGGVHKHGAAPGPAVGFRLNDPAMYARMLLNPELSVGEAYMDGSFEIVEGDLRGFLDIFHRNSSRLRSLPARRALGDFARRVRQFQQSNPVTRARDNVAPHYDTSNEFYKLILDSDMHYSCAYFETPAQSLDDAQQAKLRHIAAKLRIEPGMRVLDIGCGWGGLGMYLARELGADVVGVSLSKEQIDLANARVRERGLEGKVSLRLQDYRSVGETFDRIVSVGMFEHVGAPHFQEFFDKVRDLLTTDGLALIHAIGRRGPPGVTGPWIRKYIFPGGYSPALSETLAPIEKTGLWVTDIEILRLHYADTLKDWGRRFASERPAIKAMFDERFCRMWEFYLATAEFAFRSGGHMVFQIQLAKSHAAAPIIRDYMGAAEAGLRAKS